MATISPESTQMLEPPKRTNPELRTVSEVSLRELSHKTWSSFLVFPDDRGFQIWTSFVILLLVFCMIVTPYRIAFVDEDTMEWVVAEGVVDSIFALDLLISCCLVFHDEDHILITNHCAILKHYAKTWLAFDFIACFPLHIVLQTDTSSHDLTKLAKASRVYKIVRMFRLVRMFKLVKSKNLAVRYLSHLFRINASVERLFWFLLTLILTLHLMSCAWVFVGRYSQETDPMNWITVNNFSELEGIHLYVVSMYWTVTTVATVGYGDITACNEQEMVVNSIIMLVGVFTYSYMIGSLTNVISSLDSRKSVLNHKLDLLRELGQEYKLSKTFIEKLARAVEYDHKNTNKEVDELVASLPSSLKNQLLVSIYHRKIEGNAFFEGRSEHFVAWVVPYLKPIRFDEEEIVTREGDLAREMFFLIKGEVEFVLDKGKEYVCYVTVSPGYYFGEVELLLAQNQTRLYTTRTATKADLLSLPVERFEELLKLFENEALEILSLVHDRKSRIDERKHLAEVDYEAKKSVNRHHSVPMNLEDRKEKLETLKKALEESESDSGTDEEQDYGNFQISLMPEVECATPNRLSRLNTFGDTGNTRISKKHNKPLVRQNTNGWSKAAEKVIESKHHEVSNRDLLRYMRRIEAKIEGIALNQPRFHLVEPCSDTKLSRGHSIKDFPPDLSEADEQVEGSEGGEDVPTTSVNSGNTK